MQKRTVIVGFALGLLLLTGRGVSAQMLPFSTLRTATTPADTVATLSEMMQVVYQARNGVYWFGSAGQGLYRYDGRTLVRYSTRQGLASDFIRGIQEDTQGRIYADTPDAVCRLEGGAFTLLPVNRSTPHAWRSTPGDLWFKGGAENHGPYRFDGKTLYALDFPKSPQVDAYYKKYPGTSLDPYAIYTIYRDRKGHIWFGTGNLGLCRYDGKNISWLYEESLTYTPQGGSFGIRSILEDSQRSYWICNTRNRFRISLQDSTHAGYRYLRYRKQKGMSGSGIDPRNPLYYQYIVEKKGELWMSAFKDGVWRYDGKNLVQYPIRTGNAPAKVISVYLDRRGTVWVATEDAGLFRWVKDRFVPFHP